jgi:nitric oxide reductase subunit B
VDQDVLDSLLDDSTLWFLIEDREHIKPPRWADIGISVVMLIAFYDAAATLASGCWSEALAS